MFIHDFIRVDRPLDQVVATFGETVRPQLAEILKQAYRPDRATWIEAGARGPDITPPGWVAVEVGVARLRENAVVIPIEWNPTGGRLVASVDADLQLSGCGPHFTDLDMLGRYRLADPVPRLSGDADIARRITVTVLRRFLQSLSGILDAGGGTPSAGTVTAMSA
ncbi:MAG: hypothetical protein RIE08_07095 [Acidimicrobiales bacterium]